MEPQDKQVAILADRFKNKMVVTIKTEAWEVGDADLQWAVVLKPLAKAKNNIPALAAILKKAWNVGNSVIFHEITNDLVVAKFDSKTKMEKVMGGGPWMFKGALVLMQRWNTTKRPQELKFEKIPLWVQIHNIPLALLTQETTTRDFAEMAGTVIDTGHQEAEVQRSKFIRFRVEVDVHKPLWDGCYLKDREDQYTLIYCKYERLPKFCRRCGRLDHETDECTEGITGEWFGDWLRAESPEIMEPREELNGELMITQEGTNEVAEEGTLAEKETERGADKGSVRWRKKGGAQSESDRNAEQQVTDMLVEVVAGQKDKGKAIAKTAGGTEKAGHEMCCGEEWAEMGGDTEQILGLKFSGPAGLGHIGNGLSRDLVKATKQEQSKLKEKRSQSKEKRRAVGVKRKSFISKNNSPLLCQLRETISSNKQVRIGDEDNRVDEEEQTLGQYLSAEVARRPRREL